MERKIGEIFEHNGEWYQCVKSNGTCNGCVGKFQPYSFCSGFKECVGKIFKKLEKVGEPHFIEDEIFEGGKVYVQSFKVYKDFEGYKPVCNDYIVYDWKNRIISIEIKQNKEDMEEKKLNLKPFDLQKAKAGKPVCTRDGRKARIICFDKEHLYPIVALIECEGGEEMIAAYSKEGQTEIYETKGKDLMMLPEKHEGWVNVYRDFNIVHTKNVFDTKEEALKNISGGENCVATVKIEWEE